MKNTVIKFLTTFAAFLIFEAASIAQSNEHIVILWDVTGSLLPKEPGVKDKYTKKVLPTYKDGNGLWNELKDAVIECINYAEADPSNEITIVTFHDNIRDIFSQNTSESGKELLLDFVKNYTYKTHKHTNIVDPIKKFYTLLSGDMIKYMFLFTDGENDDPKTKPLFIPTLNDWAVKTTGFNAYGFYVKVHQDADKSGNIKQAIDSQDNFWVVNDAKVRIKICSFPSSIKYNLRDEKGPKTVSIKGKYAGADGEVQLRTDDEYYDIFCSDVAINNGRLDIQVKPKSGVTPPENHTVILTPEISKADQYTFVGPKEIKLAVSNLHQRSLDVSIEDKDFGNASYYDSFLISKASNKPAESTFDINFSEQAKKEGSYAAMKIYFVDKKGEEKLSPASQNLTIFINGDELKGDSVRLTPEMSDMTISILGQPATKKGSYYGRIELVPSNLDDYSINGAPEVFKWKFSFDHKWNPLKKGLFCFILILLAAFFLWMILLKERVYPTFKNIQKTFMIPGAAPVIINFKGAREVVVAGSHPKKQSGWNRFWTGKILYKTHPAFESPITFRPAAKRRKVYAKFEAGAYRVSPNPIPGVGVANIIDIRKNRTINVN